MGNNEHKCPICEKFKDKKLPEDGLTRHICHSLFNPEMVDSDLFSIIESLIGKWKTGKSRHYEDWVVEALEKEEITDEGMEIIKQYLVGFASETKSINLFRNALDILVLYKDKSLLVLYQGWLNSYFRECLLVGSTLNTLLACIESTGESIREDGADQNDWSTNLDAAREYLIERMKIIM